jgi:hypothetical protein
MAFLLSYRASSVALYHEYFGVISALSTSHAKDQTRVRGASGRSSIRARSGSNLAAKPSDGLLTALVTGRPSLSKGDG